MSAHLHQFPPKLQHLLDNRVVSLLEAHQLDNLQLLNPDLSEFPLPDHLQQAGARMYLWHLQWPLRHLLQ